jgi:hypothetical protein
MRIDSNVIYVQGEGKSKMVNAQNDRDNKDVVVYKFQYPSFDKHRNWLLQVEYSNGSIDRLKSRKIDYYP